MRGPGRENERPRPVRPPPASPSESGRSNEGGRQRFGADPVAHRQAAPSRVRPGGRSGPGPNRQGAGWSRSRAGKGTRLPRARLFQTQDTRRSFLKSPAGKAAERCPTSPGPGRSHRTTLWRSSEYQPVLARPGGRVAPSQPMPRGQDFGGSFQNDHLPASRGELSTEPLGLILRKGCPQRSLERRQIHLNVLNVTAPQFPTPCPHNLAPGNMLAHDVPTVDCTAFPTGFGGRCGLGKSGSRDHISQGRAWGAGPIYPPVSEAELGSTEFSPGGPRLVVISCLRTREGSG